MPLDAEPATAAASVAPSSSAGTTIWSRPNHEKRKARRANSAPYHQWTPTTARATPATPAAVTGTAAHSGHSSRRQARSAMSPVVSSGATGIAAPTCAARICHSRSSAASSVRTVALMPRSRAAPRARTPAVHAYDDGEQHRGHEEDDAGRDELPVVAGLDAVELDAPEQGDGDAAGEDAGPGRLELPGIRPEHQRALDRGAVLGPQPPGYAAEDAAARAERARQRDLRLGFLRGEADGPPCGGDRVGDAAEPPVDVGEQHGRLPAVRVRPGGAQRDDQRVVGLVE